MLYPMLCLHVIAFSILDFGYMAVRWYYLFIRNPIAKKYYRSNKVLTKCGYKLFKTIT